MTAQSFWKFFDPRQYMKILNDEEYYYLDQIAENIDEILFKENLQATRALHHLIADAYNYLSHVEKEHAKAKFNENNVFNPAYGNKLSICQDCRADYNLGFMFKSKLINSISTVDNLLLCERCDKRLKDSG